MTPQDIAQWVMIIIAAAGGILAYVESRSKRHSQNGDASESFMTAASMAGKELVEYKKQTDATIAEMQKRLLIQEHKKYSVYVEFEIGDPPIPGKVEVKPIIPPITELEYTRSVRRQRLLDERSARGEK